jgi:hypothetical protein
VKPDEESSYVPHVGRALDVENLCPHFAYEYMLLLCWGGQSPELRIDNLHHPSRIVCQPTQIVKRRGYLGLISKMEH